MTAVSTLVFDVSYAPTANEPTRSGKGYWIYKFPGLLLHFAEYAFNAETVVPLFPDRIQIKRWFWVDPDQAKIRCVDADDILRSANQVIDEDLDICERVFNNLRAGVYGPGVLSNLAEPGTAYFQTLVENALEG